MTNVRKVSKSSTLFLKPDEHHRKKAKQIKVEREREIKKENYQPRNLLCKYQ